MNKALTRCSGHSPNSLTQAIAALHAACYDDAPPHQQRRAAARVRRLTGTDLDMRPFDLLMLAEIAQQRQTTVAQVASQVIEGGLDLVDVYNACQAR